MDHHGSVRRLWTIFSYSQRPEGVSNNVLFAFSAVGAVSGLASAFILPWFPNVCREQGLTRFQTGVIFVALDATMLLLRWPMVALCRSRGVRTFYLFGFAIQGGAMFGLGWMWAIENVGFFTLAVIFRIAQGVGASMVSAASLQVINTLVYLNVNSVGTCMESVIGLSRVLGAPFGALVYHAFGGGHVALKMTFWFMAAGYGTMAIIASGTIHLPCDPPIIRDREPGQPTPWSEMFGSRAIAISLFSIFLVDAIYAALEPTLSIHLFEYFEMGVWDRGLLFMYLGLFGLLAAPLMSLVGEYTSRKFTMVGGLIGTGLALAGLAAGRDPTVADAFACILGLALSAVATPAVPAMLWDVPHDSELTDGEVARVTNALGAIAAVIGPLWGAGLAEVATFKGMALATGGMLWIYAGLQLVAFLCGGAEWRNPLVNEEDGTNKPLLQSQTEVSQKDAAMLSADPEAKDTETPKGELRS